MRFYAILTLLLCLFSSIYGFSPCTSPPISSRILNNTPPQNARHIDGIGSRRSTQLFGGKQAKFGIFSPAVYGAKLVLGEKKLQGIRGKAISLHSGYIGDFTKWAGAYHLRTNLIKKAKTNGDILGFLV
ncbi:hypothetical protein TrVE_jg9108 [Triparma verrucosa]|uniref:Uncharacterized protein n=2 Tax=Triparma TaxID=722752 RepID=A0A9W7EBN1_9STRA|nr:hypothetical protein TrST_g10214 [Triparma strigata]GMH86243.1 hypothetical protein TrVE_jg9108 [Triparma verrucosa]